MIELTDPELNKAIAEFVYPDAYEIKKVFGTSKVNVFSSPVTFPAITIDYCNNWNDLMPLVVEYKILSLNSTLLPREYLWGLVMYVRGKNPQRALVECLLEVLESK